MQELIFFISNIKMIYCIYIRFYPCFIQNTPHIKKPSWCTNPQMENRVRIFKLLRSTKIDSNELIPPGCVACGGILEQSLWSRNREWIGLSYRPARQQRLAKSIPWNRFPQGIEFRAPYKFKIPPLAGRYDNPVSSTNRLFKNSSTGLNIIFQLRVCSL